LWSSVNTSWNMTFFYLYYINTIRPRNVITFDSTGTRLYHVYWNLSLSLVDMLRPYHAALGIVIVWQGEKYWCNMICLLITNICVICRSPQAHIHYSVSDCWYGRSMSTRESDRFQ
jgi:hypothetical protein